MTLFPLSASFQKNLIRIQAASGLVFSTFSSLHVSTHLLSHFGIEIANTALFAFREYYQAPVVEILVVGGSLLTHLCASYMLWYHRQMHVKATTEKSSSVTAQNAFNEKTYHRYAGHISSIFIIGHIVGCRIVPLMYLDDASMIDLTFVTFSTQEIPYLFTAYLAIFGAAGAYHSTFGLFKSLSLLGWVPRSWSSASVSRFLRWTLSLAMISSTFAIAGYYFDIDIPMIADWQYLHSKYAGKVLNRVLQLIGISPSAVL